jgi:hypothetical protein
MRLTSSSQHLLAISPIAILLSDAPLEGPSKMNHLSVVPETIIRFLNASYLNRSRTCRFLVQFSSSSMHWMRVEPRSSKTDSTPSLLNVSLTSLLTSAFSSPRGRRVISNLGPSLSSTWTIPNWLPIQSKILACIFKKSFPNELLEDVFQGYGDKLVKEAEGLFQWAAVACGFINIPASLGLRRKVCVQHLLGHSRERDDQGPLDSLYKEVLKEYFKSHKTQIVFRSVLG